MGGILSKPKAPDTSKQEALLAEKEAKITAQEDAQKQTAAVTQAATKRARRGASRNSLLFGEETGLRKTLG